MVAVVCVGLSVRLALRPSGSDGKFGDTSESCSADKGSYWVESGSMTHLALPSPPPPSDSDDSLSELSSACPPAPSRFFSAWPLPFGYALRDGRSSSSDAEDSDDDSSNALGLWYMQQTGMSMGLKKDSFQMIATSSGAFYSLFDFFFPIPSLSIVSSVNWTLGRRLGAPRSRKTPTGASRRVEGPASPASVGVIVIVLEPVSAERGSRWRICGADMAV